MGLTPLGTCPFANRGQGHHQVKVSELRDFSPAAAYSGVSDEPECVIVVVAAYLGDAREIEWRVLDH